MTADAQLARWLWLIPAAAGEDGAGIDELSERLGTSPTDVVRDVEALTERQYYLPPGDADDLQILIEGDRLRIWTKGEFRRPARLRVREAVALGLALRVRALAAAPERAERLRSLAGHLEAQLASTDVEALERAHEIDLGRDDAGIRETLERAAHECRRCSIEYLKPGADSPDERVVRPYAIAYVEGAWYAIGWCEKAEAMRAFRVDRMLAATQLDDAFELPEDFDVEALLEGGRVFRAAEAIGAEVRYSPAIARWVVERLESAPDRAALDAADASEREPGVRHLPDGSVVVRHRVADPEWLIRHVLQYGGDAELLSPPELRDRVAERAGRMAGHRRS